MKKASSLKEAVAQDWPDCMYVAETAGIAVVAGAGSYGIMAVVSDSLCWLWNRDSESSWLMHVYNYVDDSCIAGGHWAISAGYYWERTSHR